MWKYVLDFYIDTIVSRSILTMQGLAMNVRNNTEEIAYSRLWSLIFLTLYIAKKPLCRTKL